MEKLKIGISIGDLNGIGLEVILKTVSDERILKLCTPILYGSSKVVSYHKNIVQVEFPFANIRTTEEAEDGKVNVVNCWNENVNITLGKIGEAGGKYALRALEAAVQALKEEEIDALVTAPINKKAMAMAGFTHVGHTEYITEQLEAKESLMLMVNDGLRVGLVTNHLPLSKVAENVTREKILSKLTILNQTLKVDFNIERPTIAVLALNPHAGDEGTIGMEEEETIRPAIDMAKERGMMAFGPFPADGFFGSGQHAKFDGILAMYHDQGLVAFKALSFGDGVNYTAGLSGVRTSPDHGTAFEIAGKNVADPSSFRKALFLALDIAKNRRLHAEMTANPLKSRSAKFKQGEDEVILEDV
ncbi:MAG: 4-hydroxythreonine-4-phosphate dehydrogenase PdxA [Saprospiraceae bacterium]|nr:4-hydroxythreonine-4-phosphate dehydrogenase PdxA [Saprospiraceae bacterium]